MTLGDIIEEIAEKTGNYLSGDSLVRKVNNLQAEIFRKHHRIPVTSRLDLERNNPVYPLPCPITNIIELVVDGREYDFRSFHEDSVKPFYYYLEGSFGLYPVPDRDVEGGILIFHYKVPQRLSIGNLEQEPDLDPDFRNLLVLGVCKDIANGDNARKMYREEYLILLQDFIVASSIPLTVIPVE